ncbi:MAG TPA: phage baseplate assembly protein V [Rhizomicrobium sp.]|jgi:uncharacterized protein involved in type VI secretion and phage assembly|nr:phage baseplate assembly protein V [Acetobacteraceae bacterium]
MSSSGTRYYGIYTGTVTNNVDPMQLGRIQATVPAVGGLTPSTWARPCFAFTGEGMGVFAVPMVGAKVWIQFEGGEADYPVWMGGRYESQSEVPTLAMAGIPGDANYVIGSLLKHTFVISDVPGPTGGLMLRSAGGATIIVNDTGIFIQNGKGASIVLSASTVTVNNGALVVT